MLHRSLLTLLVVATLCSCTSPVKVENVRTVSVGKIHFAKRMLKTTRADSWAVTAGTVVGGVVGGVVTSAIRNSTNPTALDDEAIRTQFDQDLRRILKEEIEAGGRFSMLPAGEATDAVLVVGVPTYGFGLTGKNGAFTGKQGPFLMLQLYLNDPQGKRIWLNYYPQAFQSYQGQSPPPPREPGTYQSHPELLLQDLNVIARQEIRHMLRGILKKPFTGQR